MIENYKYCDEVQLIEADSAKGRLVNVAAKLFNQKGYARTTVRDIASELGILSGSLFHHFPNKEAILCIAMAEAILKASKFMELAMEGTTDAKQQLRILIHCEITALHDENDPGFQLMIPEWRSLNADNRACILSLRQRYEARWHKVLESLQQQSVVNAEARVLRHFIRGALLETCNWYKPSGTLSQKELSDRLFESIIHQQ
ncbi:TetR/AcrR family transcriptional regulator [Thalassotalea psychrophila]|uniref:TetR/AcrR family transcriptional regulator n=1 Tax=Thalassotalea psychrophila TaxID=3065647 RepID=A0ABY9U065_9GAMM|nr:TetR/AcrR family transcriptional regulator [Colwelliaceae bacterium SQ149]